jgi:hypothetical protein
LEKSLVDLHRKIYACSAGAVKSFGNIFLTAGVSLSVTKSGASSISALLVLVERVFFRRFEVRKKSKGL